MLKNPNFSAGFLTGTKDAEHAVKELLRKEFIVIKLSTGEKHVSLNSHKQKEIYDFLEEE